MPPIRPSAYNRRFGDESRSAGLGETTGFTGHEEDRDLGLINVGGRMYDPSLGRFLSVDPVIADPSHSLSFNAYNYVNNRPLDFTDPSGFRAADVAPPPPPPPLPLPPLDIPILTVCYSGPCPDEGSAWGTTLGIRQDGASSGLAQTGAAAPAPASAASEGALNVGVRDGAAGPTRPRPAESRPEVASRLALVGGGLAGVATGGAMSVGTAYALGVVAGVVGAPAAGVLAAGLAVYGLYKLWDGGAKSLLDSGARLASGDGTMSDAFSLGVGLGGLLGARGMKVGFDRGLADAKALPKFGIINGGGGAGGPRAAGPTIDKATGAEVGRFVVDSKGNTMIEPVGGSTRAAGRGGVDTHTTYPNGSNYQRLNPQGHPNNPTPHGHGHLPGTGPGMRGQGPSIAPDGTVVPFTSPDAHWTIY
jgi:RHS repeat-associated protein